MTDIVERLRSYAHPNSWTASISEMLNEAADEIARLTREQQHLEHQLSLGEQLNDRLTREQVQPRAHDCALARELRFEIALLNAEIGGLKADVERLTRERDEASESVRIVDDRLVGLEQANNRLMRERDEAEAEVGRLRAVLAKYADPSYNGYNGGPEHAQRALGKEPE